MYLISDSRSLEHRWARTAKEAEEICAEMTSRYSCLMGLETPPQILTEDDLMNLDEPEWWLAQGRLELGAEFG